MNGYVKGAMLFTGGVATGLVVGRALITETIKVRSNRYDDAYEFIFDIKTAAEDVLEDLRGIISMTGQVRVSELYEILGYTKRVSYGAYNYGWTNLDNAYVIRSRYGYMLKLPNPKIFK